MFSVLLEETFFERVFETVKNEQKLDECTMEYKDHVTYSKVVLERHPTKRVCICGNICLKIESKCMTCKYDSSVTERSSLWRRSCWS